MTMEDDPTKGDDWRSSLVVALCAATTVVAATLGFYGHSEAGHPNPGSDPTQAPAPQYPSPSPAPHGN